MNNYFSWLQNHLLYPNWHALFHSCFLDMIQCLFNKLSNFWILDQGIVTNYMYISGSKLLGYFF